MILLYILALALIVRTGLKFKLCYIHLLLLVVGRINLVVYYFSDELDQRMVIGYPLATVAFCLGMLCAAGNKAQEVTRQPVCRERSLLQDGSFIALIVFFSLVVFHYAKVGIPLFADDLEIARFSTKGSGMLGIPSRVATYGPVIVLLTCCLGFVAGRFSKGAACLLSFFAVALLLMQGHKSSLALCIMVLVLSNRFLGKKLKPIWKGVATVVVPLVIFYVYYIFKRMAGLGDYNFWSYLAERYTRITLEPVNFIFKGDYDLNLVLPSISLHDLLYPFLSLLGMQVDTFNTQISRGIYGVATGDFTVPVTPTFIAYFYAECGPLLLLPVLFLLGVLCVRIYRRTNAQTTFLGLLNGLYLEYVLYMGLSTGNLFYLIPNACLVLLIFNFLFRAGNSYPVFHLTPKKVMP